MKLYAELLNNNFNNIDNNKVLLYITLIFLNNDNYSIDNMKKEISETKLVLTKLNNLKVKIQLKRKQKEIDEVVDSIKKYVDSSWNYVSCYIKDKDELFQIVDSLDAKKITDYIDRVTKREMEVSENLEDISNKRNNIINLIKNNPFDIVNNKLIIEDYDIELDDFYLLFDYLLNTNNYADLYKSVNSNENRKYIIEKIISCINHQISETEKIIIPVALTCLLNSFDCYTINTSDFEIENIKISDLYSLANQKCIDKNTSKWKNIAIPNTYLFDKMKEIICNGMYYYKDKKFVLELVSNKISDFKVSIDIDKMKLFLKNTINI